jgi:hypothetical protein
MRPEPTNITMPDANKRDPPKMMITELAAALHLPSKTISQTALKHKGHTYMKARIAKRMLDVLESRRNKLKVRFTDIMLLGERERAAKGEIVSGVSLMIKHIEKKHDKPRANLNRLSKNAGAIIRDIHDRSIRKSGARLSQLNEEGAAVDRPKESSSVQDPATPSIRSSASEPAQVPIRKFISAPSTDPVSLSTRQRLNTAILEVSRLTEEARITMHGIRKRMSFRITAIPTLRAGAQQQNFDALSDVRPMQPKKSSARVLASRTPVLDRQLWVWRGKMRKSKIKMDFLKQEYKVLMSVIHRRRLKATPQQLVRWRVEDRVAQITDKSNKLTKETPQLLDTITAELAQIRLAKHLWNLDDPLLRRVHDIETALQAAHTELHRLLRFHTVAAKLVRKVNSSARFVYQKHIVVRQRLIKMIQKRRTTEARALQARLEVLRDFTDNLFANRPGLGPSDVRAQLGKWEERGMKQGHTARYLAPERTAVEMGGPVRKMFVGKVTEDRDVLLENGTTLRKMYMQADRPLLRKMWAIGSNEEKGVQEAPETHDGSAGPATDAEGIQQRIQARINSRVADAKTDTSTSRSSRRATLTPTMSTRRRRSIRRKIPVLTVRTHKSIPKTRVRRAGSFRSRNVVRRLPSSPRKRREGRKTTAKKKAFVETVGAWLNG